MRHCLIVLLLNPWMLSLRPAIFYYQDPADLPIISYCDLIKEPKLYDGKTVKVKVGYFTTFEGGFFYDLACDGRTKRANVVLSCNNNESCQALRKDLSKDMNVSFIERRVELIIKAVFRGPGNYGSVSYKQQGFWYQLEMEKIEKSAPIPNEVPWPSTSK